MAKARHWPINCCWCNTRCASRTLCRDRLSVCESELQKGQGLPLSSRFDHKGGLKSWVSDKRCPEARNVPLSRTKRFRTWARCARLKDHLSLWDSPQENVKFNFPRLESPILELRYKTKRSKKILQGPIVIALWAEKCPLDLRPDEHVQRMQIRPVTSHYFLQKLIIYINSWIPAAHIPPASRAALVATWESQQHMSQRSDLCQKSPAAFAQALTSQRRQQLPQFKRQDLCVRAFAFDIMYIYVHIT